MQSPPDLPPSPLGRIVPRRAHGVITTALADTRVVLVNGARQAGKSTLVRAVARVTDARWRNLDRDADRLAAIASPVDFVSGTGLLVIDEI